MTYKLTNELKQLVNNIAVGKYDLIDIYNNNISKYVCIDNEERVQ